MFFSDSVRSGAEGQSVNPVHQTPSEGFNHSLIALISSHHLMLRNTSTHSAWFVQYSTTDKPEKANHYLLLISYSLKNLKATGHCIQFPQTFRPRSGRLPQTRRSPQNLPSPPHICRCHFYGIRQLVGNACSNSEHPYLTSATRKS